MSSVSFDRAAAYYDATRGYTEGSAERIRDAIVAYTGAGPATRFLELGVGTGRIALPFIRAGYDYTGVDIAQAMMDRLTAKLEGDPHAASYRYQMRQADVTQLPFDDGTFDVIITVHVLHLIEDWQRALREARRVLRSPGGWLLIGHDDAAGESRPEDEVALSPPQRVRRQWQAIRRDLGIDQPAGRSNIWGSDDRLVDYLQSLGATTGFVRLAEYQRPPITARAMAERMKARMYSSDWETPDDIHAEATRRLDLWLDQAGLPLDEPATITGDFTAIAATWSVADQKTGE
jgi:SAM-dependent methyltransferase